MEPQHMPITLIKLKINFYQNRITQIPRSGFSLIEKHFPNIVFLKEDKEIKV
jgi:hypothetical protein